MRALRLALLFLAAIFPDRTAGAQSSTPGEAPYSAISVRVSLFAPVSIGKLGPFYAAGTGGMIEAATPFNVGELSAAVGWLPFTRDVAAGTTGRNTNEDFRALVVGVGWATPALSVSRLQTSAAVRVATFRMAFDDMLVDEGIRTEDELQVSVSARAALPLGRRLSLTGTVTASHVFLHVPLNLTTASAGLEWKFALPEQVRRWLR